MSMKNSIDTIRNRTSDLPACSAALQPNALPRAPIESSTLLNVHVPSWIVMVYHFGLRNVPLLVFLMHYVFTHSPCYCDSVFDKYKELIDCQLHHIYHNICENRSIDSNFKLRATSMHGQADRHAGRRQRHRRTEKQTA
jgi:hypothetical protein